MTAATAPPDPARRLYSALVTAPDRAPGATGTAGIGSIGGDFLADVAREASEARP